jgi:hypothetical protein
MPKLDRLSPPIPLYCELHKALQWIKSEVLPVEPAFDAALGVATTISPDEYRIEFAHLFARLWKGELAIEGRPYEGEFVESFLIDGEPVFTFDPLGSFEEIPVEKIRVAGSGAFCIRSGCLRYWRLMDGKPGFEAWVYQDLRLKTADLLSAFPPLAGEIGNMADASVALGTARATEQTASEQPVGGDGQPPYQSEYMALIDQAVTELGITVENQPAHKALQHWFRQRLIGGRQVSERQAANMATIVRCFEAQKGGNRSRRRLAPNG